VLAYCEAGASAVIGRWWAGGDGRDEGNESAPAAVRLIHVVMCRDHVLSLDDDDDDDGFTDACASLINLVATIQRRRVGDGGGLAGQPAW